MKRLILFLFSLLLITAYVVPADAWVAAGGGYHGAAVGPRGAAVYGPHGAAVVARPYGAACCYHPPSYNAAGAFVAGAVVGATTVAATHPAPPPTVVVVQPVAVPSPGTIFYSLPSSCQSVLIGNTSYYTCSSVYYRPVYQAGTLVYQVVPAP